ncbi:hypothetical protein LQ327_14315 [Actinomycetospora endophytica]|uniref:DUF5709 domain-containing protein n=1 Tax=Actinomycetospora endophytica TaxID=2291215 RepID=A0ABS8PC39_9PSEU|nr:hypothetical protein [Actinomycetospora endophytica]MCD2194544.1 hypothetical protein [Actinomycetospora endophytica]
MTSSGEVPDDAPVRPRPDRTPDDAATDGALPSPVGDPRDAWLRKDGDELRYGGRLDVPAGPEGDIPVGAEVEDRAGRTWAVEGDAHPIGESGVVLEPEPDPSTPADRRLGVTTPEPDADPSSGT